MNEDMVGKPVLNPQRKTVDRRVFRITPARIHIMDREYDLLPHQPVEKHEQRTIEDLEFVIPQDMKYLWLGCGGVMDQLGVVLEYSGYFFCETGIPTLIAPQIKKVQSGFTVELRKVELVAANQIYSRAF